MAIQIDRSLLLPKIEERTKKRKFYSDHQDQTSSLTDETINICQQWMDDKVYSGKDISTRRDCRTDMYAYALDNIDLRSRDKSYFIPTFIWTWLAQKLIWYIIGLIIENYWLREDADESLFYLLK